MNTLAGSLGMAFSRSELLGVALIRLEVTRCLDRSAGKDRSDRWGLLEDLGYWLRLQRSGFEGRQSGGVFLASGPPLSISQWPNSTGAQDSPGKACLSITPYSNFGGAAIRYGEVPGALGVLESPDNPMPIGIACGSSGRSRGPGVVPAPGPQGGSPQAAGVPKLTVRAGRRVSGAGGLALR